MQPIFWETKLTQYLLQNNPKWVKEMKATAQWDQWISGQGGAAQQSYTDLVDHYLGVGANQTSAQTFAESEVLRQLFSVGIPDELPEESAEEIDPEHLEFLTEMSVNPFTDE